MDKQVKIETGSSYFCSSIAYDDYARDVLGATHSRNYICGIYRHGVLCVTDTCFSVHYFNSDDVEIAYYIKDMVKLLGITILEKPRVWGDKFKLSENYSKPTCLKNYCVTQCGYVGEKRLTFN